MEWATNWEPLQKKCRGKRHTCANGQKSFSSKFSYYLWLIKTVQVLQNWKKDRRNTKGKGETCRWHACYASLRFKHLCGCCTLILVIDKGCGDALTGDFDWKDWLVVLQNSYFMRLSSPPWAHRIGARSYTRLYLCIISILVQAETASRSFAAALPVWLPHCWNFANISFWSNAGKTTQDAKTCVLCLMSLKSWSTIFWKSSALKAA